MAKRHRRAALSKPPSKEAGPQMLFLLVLGAAVVLMVTQMKWPAKSPLPDTPAVATATNPPSAVSNVFAALPATGTNATNDAEEAANQLQNEGERLFEQGRVEEAIQRYKQALEKNAEDEDTHYNLAIAYDRKGMTNEALHEYRQAIEIFPEYNEAHNNLANLLGRCGRIKEAEAEFTNLVKRAPEYAGAHNNYGAMLARLGRYAEATAQFRQAVRYSTNYAEAHVNLATALMRDKQWDEAITNLEAALAQYPDWPMARERLEQAKQAKSLNR